MSLRLHSNSIEIKQSDDAWNVFVRETRHHGQSCHQLTSERELIISEHRPSLKHRVRDVLCRKLHRILLMVETNTLVEVDANCRGLKISGLASLIFLSVEN